jgi:general L-amino acid transport system permease protein
MLDRLPPTAHSWNNDGCRSVIYQLLLAAAVGLAAWYFTANAAANLQARNIASGFAFLWREAGFEISETTLFSYSAADTYIKALGIGLLNTFRVSAVGIILATVLGSLIGLARLSGNWLLARLAAGYVELIRNIPLLVQLFFWYSLITENLPAPAAALSPFPGVFLSNRGIAFPTPDTHSDKMWLAAAFMVGIIFALMLHAWTRLRPQRPDKSFPTLAVGTALVFGLFLAFYIIALLDWNRPVLAGFNFSGGATLSPEFAALLTGLVLYTSAFIAEIVRAGITSVDRGQFEAANSLGMSRWQALRFIILPQALRAIVPPLTSQYLNLTKNSSLAVAIGYPDLVSTANTIISQTGQAIEGIAIIMLVYLTISLTISALMNVYNRRIMKQGGRS